MIKMGSFSGLWIGFSFVLGCILMGLCYLLWWKKKKISNSNSNSNNSIKESQEFSSLLCWRKPKSCTTTGTQDLESTRTKVQPVLKFNLDEMSINHMFPLKKFRYWCGRPGTSTPRSAPATTTTQEIQDLETGDPNKEVGFMLEEGIEAELMRVHNLCGPPRFLFTIKEESKEDLESDDGRSRKGSRTRSLSDVVSLDSYNHHGINPLFESIPEAEIDRLRSSPPSKFKFLRDAEDKLLKRVVLEEEERKMDEKRGSFVKFLDVREKVHDQATQVLPLPSCHSCEC